MIELKFIAGSVPGVKPGSLGTFIIMTRSKESRESVFPAYYLNDYPLNYDEGCEDRGCPKEANHDDGCPTTGWFYDESNFEYDNCCHSISAEVIAWADLPEVEAVKAALQEAA